MISEGLLIKGIILTLTAVAVGIALFLTKKEFKYRNLFFYENYEDLTLLYKKPDNSISVVAVFDYHFVSGLPIKLDFYADDIVVYPHYPIHERYVGADNVVRTKAASIMNFNISFKKLNLNRYKMILEKEGRSLSVNLSREQYDLIINFMNSKKNGGYNV